MRIGIHVTTWNRNIGEELSPEVTSAHAEAKSLLLVPARESCATVTSGITSGELMKGI